MKKGDRSVGGFSINYLTKNDIKLKLEYKGFGGLVSHRASKVSILRKSKQSQKEEYQIREPGNDEDSAIFEVIMKYYPHVTTKQKYFLTHALYQLIACGFSVVTYSSVSSSVLQYRPLTFKKQDEIDEVLQQMCDKNILDTEVRRLYQFKGLSFNVSEPQIFLKLKNDFVNSAMEVLYPDSDDFFCDKKEPPTTSTPDSNCQS